MYFDHAATVVDDIAEAVEWHLKALPDATVLYQDATWAFLEARGARLAFVIRSQHPGHLAWRVSETELLELAEKHNKKIDCHRDGSKGFYIGGPSRCVIEFICLEGTAVAAPIDGPLEPK